VEIELTVRIDTALPGGYRSQALQLPQPDGLAASQAIAFELADTGWIGRTQVSGAQDVCERDVLAHLRMLLAISKENPAWLFHIEIAPDGGRLELRAGSFGADDDEIQGLLRFTEGRNEPRAWAHEKLYVSIRLDPDAQMHFLDLVKHHMPPTWPAPITEPGPHGVALGFELSEDTSRTLQLITVLRQAWHDEGSLATCIAEVEGAEPIVKTINSLAGWSQLERQIRQPAIVAATKTSVQVAATVERSVVGRVVSIPKLGDRMLTWVAGRDRLRGLTADGTIWSLSERIECSMGDHLVRRRSDGSSAMFQGRRQIAQVARTDAARHFHTLVANGALFTDTVGDHARVRLLAERGVVDGPQLYKPEALVASSSGHYVFALCEVGGYPTFVTMHCPSLGWDYRTPWPPEANIRDLAAAGDDSCVAASDGAVYVIDSISGALRQTIHVPCREPKICFATERAVWLVGAAAGTPTRCDLFRIDLVRATCTIETAMIDSVGWGGLDAARCGRGWVLAFAARGVFWLYESIEAVVSLREGEAIVELCHDGTIAAVVTQSASGHQVAIGSDKMEVIELPEALELPLLQANE
jgi:hypothetical protein